MQSLEDQESQFKKEILKSFDPKLESKCLLDTSETNSSNLYYYSTKIKKINFLHFCLNETENNEINAKNLLNNTNFRSMFNTLSKLNKSINIFNGDLNKNTLNVDDLSFLNNVHASMSDINGLLDNYFEKSNNSNENFRLQSSNVSLLSNIYETCSKTVDLNEKNVYSNFLRKNMKLFGKGNHSTMLFEYQNIKIGFMGLIDELIYDKLINAIKSKSGQVDLIEEKDVQNPVDYIDFVTEADRLSKQLRQCGANLIVALTNMQTDLNEQRLFREAQDLDIVYSSRSNSKRQVYNIDNRWMVKSSSNSDSISLVSLCLDELDCNRILDISISKYLVE